MKNKIQVGQRKEEGIKNIKVMVTDMFLQLETLAELSKILLENEEKQIALQIIEGDKDLDDMMSDITIEISNFITREQPLAQDLRFAIANLSIIRDLERMGDYYKNYAKFTLKAEVNSKTQNQILAQTMDMLFERIQLLKEIYLSVDHKAAKQLAKKDIEIDALIKELLMSVNGKLVKESDLSEVEKLSRIISIARVFERSGDHIVNICEQVSYIAKGQIYHYQ